MQMTCGWMIWSKRAMTCFWSMRPYPTASHNPLPAKQAFQKMRYKGKLFNALPPRDYGRWEEICCEYTRHIAERYGIKTVSGWHDQCHQRTRYSVFFRSDLTKAVSERLESCCGMYAAFERGVRRVSDRVRIGAPVIASRQAKRSACCCRIAAGRITASRLLADF